MNEATKWFSQSAVNSCGTKGLDGQTDFTDAILTIFERQVILIFPSQIWLQGIS
jgi:hypothetical protein